jgi:2-oxoacid:acceptor oxidoreductase delta subunit (pyruvate/2-ketoisovalerate family)
VHDIEVERESGRFDAVFLAVGAQLGKRVNIPAGDSSKILDAVSFLHDVAEENPPLLGRRVVVYGGGDTAMDAARTARRLGATEAVVVYRRNQEKMPAHDEEYEQARVEGVSMRWLSTISQVQSDRIVIEKMRLNEDGFPEATGEFEELGADAVVLALGQDTDLSLLARTREVRVNDGAVEVAADLMTDERGVFAGGDAATSDRTATVAVGHGKKAAHSIDAYVRGVVRDSAPRHELADFASLNTWYYSDAERTRRPELERVRRQDNFEEVVLGLTERNALFEARRCMSCGNCFECDNCFGVCPDNAVIKLADLGKYEFNYDYCKGCGICVRECPCGAIEMVPERI